MNLKTLCLNCKFAELTNQNTSSITYSVNLLPFFCGLLALWHLVYNVLVLIKWQHLFFTFILRHLLGEGFECLGCLGGFTILLDGI